MKKAAQKSAAPVTLGTKRVCPSCATKFYDFNKDPIHCPKCETKVDPAAINPLAKLPEVKKAPKVPEKSDSDDVGGDEPMMESVDDLGDEDEEELDDIDVGNDENDS